MSGVDRVRERRRAAAVARHYRDEEDLSIAEIARRLGRAEATVKAYLYDPTGEKARAVKARYVGVCRAAVPTRSRAMARLRARPRLGLRRRHLGDRPRVYGRPRPPAPPGR
jgi:transposase